MRFQVNDVVVHEVYGLGKVLEVKELTWMNPESPFFYVVEVGDARIWVPVENEENCHIREVTPKADLLQYREILTSDPRQLQEDRFCRSVYLRESGRNPSFGELCATVRDMTAHSWNKKLSKSETERLQRITAQLVEEWALSAGVPVEQAEKEVTTLLQQMQGYPHPSAE